MNDDGLGGPEGGELLGLLAKIWNSVWKWFVGLFGLSMITITVFDIDEINIGRSPAERPSPRPSVDCSRGAPGFTQIPEGFRPGPRVERMLGAQPPRAVGGVVIQERPTTVGDLRAYLAAAPAAQREALSFSTWQRDPDPAPARDIPWPVADDYARWQSDRDESGCAYRLPSLDEWRQAAAHLADPEGSIGRGPSQRTDWLWGFMEWTGENCSADGKIAVGAQLSKLNSDRGGGDPYPATRCLGADAAAYGAPGVGFRLIREPARGG